LDREAANDAAVGAGVGGNVGGWEVLPGVGRSLEDEGIDDEKEEEEEEEAASERSWAR